MMTHILILFGAYLIDRMIGDPRWLPHPVVWMGTCTTYLEKWIRSLVSNEKYYRLLGCLFPLLIVGGSYLVTWLLLQAAALVHPLVSTLLEVWIISATIATKGLADAGWEIYHHLRSGNLEKARVSLSMVVGRDTEKLDEAEVCRGAVETVAENMVDAIVSPLFYAAIGGAPLAIVYRAVNTLDSMVGYKNEKYRYLGWASARLDDLANYLPARLTALLLVAASRLKRLDWRACWRMIRRDARLHPSPNSGFPEAGIAGALGIQLGGLNYYQGVPSMRARMGDPTRSIQMEDIKKTINLMKLVSLLCMLGSVACLWFASELFFG